MVVNHKQLFVPKGELAKAGCNNCKWEIQITLVLCISLTQELETTQF